MVLEKISLAGTAIWLDDLSRERMERGGKASYLPDLISEDFVVGVTTNPAIFSAAISNSALYQADIASLSAKGITPEEIITELTTSDVRNACDLFAPIYQTSNGVDGRVSIEVDPRLARDTAGTVSQAKRLWELVDRPNVLIKVPATREGLPAIKELISAGISVNVTIIFSVSRYVEVVEAFIAGLEERNARGESISGIHSVASFFISRVDTEIDSRLAGSAEEARRGKAAIANARLAYKHFEKVLNSQRWISLAERGARLQRPLWASTGVKDPNYDPTMYVVNLVAPETVNTMPEATLKALRSTDEFHFEPLSNYYQEAEEVIASLRTIGIDIEEVAEKLEAEGLDKFVKPWLELIEVVAKASR